MKRWMNSMTWVRLGITVQKDIFFVDVLNSDYDDEEMRRGFLKKNGGKISHEVVLGVLWVYVKYKI
jgi:hypothetical protein